MGQKTQEIQFLTVSQRFDKIDIIVIVVSTSMQGKKVDIIALQYRAPGGSICDGPPVRAAYRTAVQPYSRLGI